MSKYISIGLISLFLSHGFACATDLVAAFEVVDEQRQIALRKFFPTQFSAEHVKQLANQQQAPSELSFASFTLDKENSSKFQSAIPYRFQILTGTWPQFAANITKIEGSERRVDPTKLVATYKFTSPYIGYNNVQFDVALEGKTYNLLDSVLGDKDFVRSPTQPINDACFFYIAYTNEEFVRQTTILHRLNLNITKWLLICAQLHGEDIFGLDENARQVKGQELFQLFLTEKNYVLSSVGVLQMDEYVDCMKTLQTKILASHGVCVEDVPSKIADDQVMQFAEGKLFVKARVGE